MAPKRYVEVLEVVWRPHRDAPSLLGNGYDGSTLTDVPLEDVLRLRPIVRKRRSTRRYTQSPRRYGRRLR